MKKFNILANAIAVLTIGAAITGCSKEKEVDAVSGATVTIYASLPQTKTSFTADGNTVKVAWSAKDKISLYDITRSGISAEFSSTEEAEGTTATDFSGVIDAKDGDAIVALYPSSLKVENLKASVDYSAQSGTLASIQSIAPMTASGSFSATSTSLSFVNQAAILKMDLTFPSADEIASLTISSSDGSLKNKADLDLSGAAPAWTNMTSGDVAITFGTPAHVAENGIMTIYALAIPQTAKGLRISAMNKSNTVEYYYETASSEAVFSSGKVNPLSQTLTKKKLTTELVQKSVLLNASQIGVSWSVSDFNDPTADKADAYIFGIYSEEGCSNADLLVRWSAEAGWANWQWTTPYGNYPEVFNVSPRFHFSGLKPNTKYYVKIENTTKNVSSVASYTTSASDVVDIAGLSAGSANAGQVILSEDFGEILWGSEAISRCAGYKPSDVKTPTSYTYASGDNANIGSTSDDLVRMGIGTGYFFDTKSGCGLATSGTRLKNWAGWMSDNKSLSISEYSGNLRIGSGTASSTISGDIVTPELAALSGTAKVKVEFDCAPYYEVAYEPLTYLVHVFDGATAADNMIAYSTSPSQTFSGSIEKKYEWQHVSLEISNVKPTSRIGIGTDGKDYCAETSKKYHRMYFDNIKITVLSY